MKDIPPIYPAICLLVFVLCLTFFTASAATASSTAGRFNEAEALVRQAVQAGDVSGAVLFIEQQGKIEVHRTFGNAALRPAARPLSETAIFDLASLTKPVATSTAVMMLWENGQINLDAPVSQYLPVFKARPDKADITVRHLLTHTSGLVAGGNFWGKTLSLAQMSEIIAFSPLKASPGKSFLYSDFSFLVLGAIVEEVSGMSLDRFCREKIFAPLGMYDTFFRHNEIPLPPATIERMAATTAGDDTLENRGMVHDPTARALGGVAGNAGLFSTATDLARFCRMILNRGELDGVRLLQPHTVQAWISNQSPALPGQRSLGWDLGSPYSVRGGLSELSFGHTGYTGTSLWIDPASQTFIILLTNAVHAKPSQNVTRLRRAVSNAVARAQSTPVAAGTVMSSEKPATFVQTGLEVLVAENFRRLEGRKVGVVCNHTAVDRQRRHLVDLMAANKKVDIVALFGPEHGIRGDVDAAVSDSVDAKTGIKVFSLYDYRLPVTQRYRPTPAMLAGIDTLVFDVQDIGSRYYTYISTLGYLLEAAAQQNIKVVVLDRPNPLGGNLVEGPLLDARFGSFAGYHSMPITHGMTIGELALLFNAERNLGAEIEVVRMKNWKRDQFFDATGLPWLNPSPNIRNVRQAWLYAGIGFLEVLPLSVGRGTDTPFEILGAPWLDAAQVSRDLNTRNLPGVTFVPTYFTPKSSKFADVECAGVQIHLWDRTNSRPTELGIHVLDALVRRHPDRFSAETLKATRGMIGNETIANRVRQGDSPESVIASWSSDVADWQKRRAAFLLYP